MSGPVRDGVRFSTNDIRVQDRSAWLRDVIGREYAHVEITPPPDGSLFNEMAIFSQGNLRVADVRSSALTVERLERDVDDVSHDEYFAILLMSGQYRLRQDGREVFLKPGDMALYDATMPHRIDSPAAFSKAIVCIPRSVLQDRMNGVQACTAMRIPGDVGIGAVVSKFIRATVQQHSHLALRDTMLLAENTLDLLTMALSSVRPASISLSRSRASLIAGIKSFVARHLTNPELNQDMVAQGVGLSVRYINQLMQDQGMSLMRYVLKCRLEQSRKDIERQAQTGLRLVDIAYKWGFNDQAHFSRAFKTHFGCSPRDFQNNSK